MLQVNGYCLLVLPDIDIESGQINTALYFVFYLSKDVRNLFDSLLMTMVDYLYALLDLLSVHGLQGKL